MRLSAAGKLPVLAVFQESDKICVSICGESGDMEMIDMTYSRDRILADCQYLTFAKDLPFVFPETR